MSNASETEDALKKTFRAFSQTTTGKDMGKRLEKTLYINKIPDNVKRMQPFILSIVNRRISYKWTF